jgi:hypothetical protein
MSLKYLVVAAPALGIWLALIALTYLMIRLTGWEKVKQYTWSLLVLLFALFVLPMAGLGGLAWSYRGPILYKVESFWYRSPMIIMGQGCTMFPANNIWNAQIGTLPVAAHSDAYVNSIGRDLTLHADFGARAGIPYMVVDASAPMNEVNFENAEESDPGPYRIPSNAPIENGADGHVLVVDKETCRLYELYAARWAGKRWEATSGAIFDLRANTLRPLNWTSTDAAGLPVLPGLVRYQEVEDGEIRHALRFTARRTQHGFVWPARHRASSLSDENVPPMGQRFRLKQGFSTAGFAPETQVILTALKNYGIILADNGGDWYITGGPDSRWPSRVISELRKVKGSDMEAVDASGLMVDKDSGEARP